MKAILKNLLLLFSLALVGATLCYCASPYLGYQIYHIGGRRDVVRHDQELEAFARNLFETPLPEKTWVLSRNAYVSEGENFEGLCDFYAEQVILTGLSQAELERYYEGVTFPPVRREMEGKERTGPNGWPFQIKVWIQPLESHHENGLAEYHLRVYDIGYPPGWDYRCAD